MRRLSLWGSLLEQINNERANKISTAAALLAKEKCRRDPVWWLSNFVYTVKSHREKGEAAIQPFPIARPYCREVVNTWVENPIIHIIKSRQMSITWISMAMLLWEAQFEDYALCVVINKKLDDAINNGISRAKLIYNNQPQWLKNLCPLDRKMRDMPKDCLTFKNGSKIQALPEGPDQVRSLVPTTAVIDEAAFQEQLEATYSACVPCCARIVTVSSAGPGFFERLCK